MLAAEGVGRAGQPGRGPDLRPYRGRARRPPPLPARRPGSRWPCCSRSIFAGAVRRVRRGAAGVRRAAVPRRRHRVRLLPGALRRHAGRDDRRLRRADPADDLAGRGPRAGHPDLRRASPRSWSNAAGGGLPGHRAMGLFVGALIVVGALGAFFGTRGELRSAASRRASRRLRAQLRGGRSQPAVPAAADLLRRPGGRHRDHAGRGQVLRRRRSCTSPDAATDAAVRLLRRPGPAGHAALVPDRRPRRQAPRATSLASLLLAAGALAPASLAPVLPAVVVYLITALIGCGYAGQQVFGLAMLPDCIAFDTARTGRRQAGVFTGVWTAGETFGLALGPGIYALVLQLFGYVSSDTGDRGGPVRDGPAGRAARLHRAPSGDRRPGRARSARLRP